MANGMSSLMVGASGLKTAQAALNTTAHNLSNINTDGYTRQQIGFTDTLYVKVNTSGSPISSTCGMGVSVHEVRRLRDTFIDKAYRTENGRYGYYNSQYKAVEEIEDLFGEMQGVTFQESMTNLYDSINELSKEPASTVQRSSLMQNASAFLTRADAVYQGLKDYQETLNEDVLNMINSINDLSNTIYDLNKQISKIESAGQESANDLRDQRDAALDELSEYIRISYYEKENGEVMVQAENVPIVTTTSVIEMSYRTSDSNNLYIPTFPAYGSDVYSDNALYGTNSYDQGSLKGLLLARGSITVDYTDVPVKPDKDDAKYYDASGTFDQETYDRDYAVYEQKQAYYDKYIEPSAILSAIAGLDKLVNGICTALNEVICPTTTEVKAAGGATVDYSKMTSVLKDSAGNEIIPDSYEYENDEAVMYDYKGNRIEGYQLSNGKYYYTSVDKLYKTVANTGTLDSATNIYTFTSNQYKMYDDTGKAYYGTENVAADGSVTYAYRSIYSTLYETELVNDPTYYNYSILDRENTDYGNDEDRSVGEGIFSRENTEDFVVAVDANGNAMKDADGKDILVHNNANTNGLRSSFQAGNIIMDPDTSQNVALLEFTTLEGKEDMARGQALVDAWTGDFASLNPENYAVGNFETFYNNFTSEFATVGKVLNNFVSYQQTMVDGYDDQRQQTTGVSSDDELQKMIKYQQAYNAASRYINVISEMLEHLVTSLGNA